MPGHRHDGLGMVFFLPKSHIELAPWRPVPSFMKEDDGACSLDLSPFVITIDFGLHPAEEDTPPLDLRPAPHQSAASGVLFSSHWNAR